jgi:hypothetical protein
MSDAHMSDAIGAARRYFRRRLFSGAAAKFAAVKFAVAMFQAREF